MTEDVLSKEIEVIFQLTRPAWGVTPCNAVIPILSDISTHTPCVGRDLKMC